MTPERAAPRAFDPRLAAVGAVVMGGVVFAINQHHGAQAALVAALKQAAYTFVAGGVIIGLCRTLSVSRLPAPVAVTAATVLPAALSTLLTLLVHLARGTPEPWMSTLPTALIVPPSCLGIALLHRRRVRG